jgi:NDP-sugar pyrophosphorylase family protein
MENLKAMVLAAGVGSRLDPLTRQLAKPLVPVANRPVMEHILLLLKKHGITDVVSNLHHLPSQVPAYFGDGSNLGMNLHYHHEHKLSGDAGGVRACKDFLGDATFVVIMGDLLTDADLSYVLEQHRRKGAIATIALQKVADVSRFGVAALNDDGLIQGFQEKPAPQEALSDLASTGIYILEPEIFQHLGEADEIGFGRQIFPSLIAKGLPVLGVQVYGYWSDIGTIDTYKQASKEALMGLADLNLAGSLCARGWFDEDADIAIDTDVDGLLMVGKNSKIDSGVKMSGAVTIGDNCHVQAGAFLEDTIVWSGSTIGAGASLESCVVGADVFIDGGSHVNEICVDAVMPFVQRFRRNQDQRVVAAG